VIVGACSLPLGFDLGLSFGSNGWTNNEASHLASPELLIATHS